MAAKSELAQLNDLVRKLIIIELVKMKTPQSVIAKIVKVDTHLINAMVKLLRRKK